MDRTPRTCYRTARRGSDARRRALRVLFIWLNHDTPVGFSHGLAVLSQELKSAGHTVQLLHVNEQLGLGFDLERIGSELRRRHPEVVGLGFGSNHAAAAAQIARRAHELVPDVWVIAGGTHATLYPEEVMSWPGVDLVALGEVDDFRLVQVLEGLARDRLPRGRAGFWFRERGVVVKNPIALPVDLHRVRSMDLKLFDHRRILELKRGWADVHAGRGCPQRCTYCFNEPLRRRYLEQLGRGSKLCYVRRRPIAVVLEELAEYRRLYGPYIRAFSFTDDQFVTSRRWLYEFLEAYQADFAIPLVFLSSAAAIDAEVARRSARAGVYMVRLGVESGSARVRERILKRRTPARVIRRAVDTLQRAGVNAFTFQMLGIPGETMRDVWATFRFGANLRADAVKFSMFWPYPGTQLHELCLRDGLMRPGLEFVGNNIQDSPLRWPRSRQLFFRRVAQFFDVALNRHLGGRHSDRYAKLLERLRRLDESDWQNGGRLDLRERTDSLNEQVLGCGGEAYLAPFADRPDILLLQGRHRSRPLLM
ncbi:MAG: radical SAM protein [Polyangiaceae bacterium]|nr:radical SAM protein [Polyangiaceae bacterium]